VGLKGAVIGGFAAERPGDFTLFAVVSVDPVLK